MSDQNFEMEGSGDPTSDKGDIKDTRKGGIFSRFQRKVKREPIEPIRTQQHDEAAPSTDDYDDRHSARTSSPFVFTPSYSERREYEPLVEREEKERKLKNVPLREAERKAEALLAREDVTVALQSFTKMLSQQPGKPYILGITSTGLVVAVREGCNPNATDDEDPEYGYYSRDGHFRAWAGNVANLATFKKDLIETSFPLSFVDRDRNENTSFPNGLPEDEKSAKFLNNIQLSDADISQLPELERSQVLFYKATGGFYERGPMKLPDQVLRGTLLSNAEINQLPEPLKSQVLLYKESGSFYDPDSDIEDGSPTKVGTAPFLTQDNLFPIKLV